MRVRITKVVDNYDRQGNLKGVSVSYQGTRQDGTTREGSDYFTPNQVSNGILKGDTFDTDTDFVGLLEGKTVDRLQYYIY